MYRRSWTNNDLLENHPRLNINTLFQANALVVDAQTTLEWPDRGLKGSLLATDGEIFLTGFCEQRIEVGWTSVIGGRYARPRFFCRCGRSCYHLVFKGDKFLCRVCAGYDWRSRHRRGYATVFRRIAKLRKKLNADPAPFSELPPPPRAPRSRWFYNRLAEQLRHAEAAAYVDLGVLLTDLEHRPEAWKM
jgi:hypothetical protein